jgi:hypothetical protein
MLAKIGNNIVLKGYFITKIFIIGIKICFLNKGAKIEIKVVQFNAFNTSRKI